AGGSRRSLAILAISGIPSQHDRGVRAAAGRRAAEARPQAGGSACLGGATRAHTTGRVAAGSLTDGPSRRPPRTSDSVRNRGPSPRLALGVLVALLAAKRGCDARNEGADH